MVALEVTNSPIAAPTPPVSTVKNKSSSTIVIKERSQCKVSGGRSLPGCGGSEGSAPWVRLCVSKLSINVHIYVGDCIMCSSNITVNGILQGTEFLMRLFFLILPKERCPRTTCWKTCSPQIAPLARWGASAPQALGWGGRPPRRPGRPLGVCYNTV